MMVSQRASQDCCCQKLLDKISRIAYLEGEVARLKAKLARQERTAKEKPFGLSTPSSKQLVKPSVSELSEEELIRRKGGAKPGHVGHGWKALEGPEPELEILPAPDACPCCGAELEDFPGESETIRDLLDCQPQPVFRRRVKVPARYCPHCRKPVRPRVPGVLPKTRLSNNVLARVAADHYLDGIPMGTVSRRLAIGKGTLFAEMHRLAELMKPALEGLIGLLRDAAVKQADETPWRTDGNNGYAWVFIAGRVSVFICEKTRSMKVPEAVLAQSIGTLATDRYAAYNCFHGERNYCFEHLRRDTLAIVEDNPKSKECVAFSGELVPWLCKAISLDSLLAGDNVSYYLQATFIRYQIEKIVNSPAQHPSVQHIQNIFRENESRLWMWTCDRRVPSHNNAAERTIRPVAIARKVSHGSQSEKGRETRSALMSVLHTLSNCCVDPVQQLADALERYAVDRRLDMFSNVFGNLPLYIPTQ